MRPYIKEIVLMFPWCFAKARNSTCNFKRREQENIENLTFAERIFWASTFSNGTMVCSIGPEKAGTSSSLFGFGRNLVGPAI